MANYRFGKHPPKVDYRTLRLSNYLKPGIAAPPASFNVLTNVYAKLGTDDPTKLFPMDGNDTLGDCTIAALAHAETIFRSLLGKEKIASRTSVVKLYMHLTGGVDSGLNELDVLNYWRKNSFSGDKIINYSQRIRAAVRGAHRMPIHFQQHGEGVDGIGPVVDEKDPSGLRHFVGPKGLGEYG